MLRAVLAISLRTYASQTYASQTYASRTCARDDALGCTLCSRHYECKQGCATLPTMPPAEILEVMRGKHLQLLQTSTTPMRV